MTDDRALLKDAAKAAGIPIQYNRFQNHPIICTGNEKDGDPVIFWNPLLDDGDALRLAVKLRIDVSFPLYRKPDPALVHAGRYWHVNDSCWYPFDELLADDPYAATRRAIVSAAAEIGRTK